MEHSRSNYATPAPALQQAQATPSLDPVLWWIIEKLREEITEILIKQAQLLQARLELERIRHQQSTRRAHKAVSPFQISTYHQLTRRIKSTISSPGLSKSFVWLLQHPQPPISLHEIIEPTQKIKLMLSSNSPTSIAAPEANACGM